MIYEENHSFDNLYGSWGSVNGRHVEGLADASTREDPAGAGRRAVLCLPQNDVNLTSPPLRNTCQDPAHGITASHFANRPFSIDDFIDPRTRRAPRARRLRATAC